LITGTARGLGVAIAEQFGRDGANVLLVDRDTESLPDVAEKVRLAGASDVAWTGQDVNAEESTKRLKQDRPRCAVKSGDKPAAVQSVFFLCFENLIYIFDK
jgi:NAD(P)-dependent dehydrogenase (short-subunit alcohol dehydrogenase family)